MSKSNNIQLNNKISSYQLTIAIISSIIGVGFVALPRSVGKEVGNPNAWISVLISSLIATISCLVISKLVRSYPNQTIYEYSFQLTGKIIGFIISFVFSLYWLAFAAWETRIHAELVSHILFNYTPPKLMYSLFILIGIYLIIDGIQPVIKINELIVPISLILLFIMLILACLQIDINNLRPLFSGGIKPITKGVTKTTWSLSGYEILMAIGGFLVKKNDIYKASVIAVNFSIFICLIITLISIGVLSLPEVITLTWPTLEMVKTIELPGKFFEQFEIIFISVWILKIFGTYVLCHYSACLGFSKLFKINIKYICYITAPIVLIMTSLPKSLNILWKISDILDYFTLVFIFIIPMTLLIITLIKNKKAKKKQ